MKKRYIFPLVYMLLVLLAQFVSVIEAIVTMILQLFAVIVYVSLMNLFNLPVGYNSPFIIILTTIQFYLIGYVWNYIAEKVNDGNFKKI